MSKKINSQGQTVEAKDENVISVSSVRSKTELRNINFNFLRDPEIQTSMLRTFSYKTIKQMNADPIIAFSYAVLSSVISSLPYNIRCENKIQEAVIRHTLERHYVELMQGMCTGIYYGFSYAQKIYKKEEVRFTHRVENKKGVPKEEVLYAGAIDGVHKLKWLDPSVCATGYVANRRTEELKYVYQYIERKKVIVPRRDLFWFGGEDVFDPIFGKSRYLNIYFPWECTKILSRYLLEGIDSTSSSMIEIRYPIGTINMGNGETAHGSEVAKILRDEIVSGNTSYIIPSTRDSHGKEVWSVQVNRDAAEANSAIYDTIKDLIIMYYGQVMMGMFMPPALNPVDEAKDLGDSETSMELLMLTSETLVRKMESTIRKDLIDDVVKMNIPKDQISPYSFEIDKSIFNRRQMIKELVTTMLTIVGQGITSGSAIPRNLPDLEALLTQLNVPTTAVDTVFKTLSLSDASLQSDKIVETLKEKKIEKTEQAEKDKLASDTALTSNPLEAQDGVLDKAIDQKQREGSRVAPRKSEKMKDGGRRPTVIKGA